MGDYKILEDISANVTFVQLMDSLGNVNHAISVFGHWIFDSKYERQFILNRALLYMICAPSVGEEQNAIFEFFFGCQIHFYLSKFEKRIVLICPPKHIHDHFYFYVRE